MKLCGTYGGIGATSTIAEMNAVMYHNAHIYTCMCTLHTKWRTEGMVMTVKVAEEKLIPMVKFQGSKYQTSTQFAVSVCDESSKYVYFGYN